MHKRLALAALLVAAAGWARQATVTLLATTDLHGNIYPTDYFTGRPAERGLAKIATIVQSVRRETPNTILIDCGDTIQGTPLEAVYQAYVSAGRLPLNLAFAGEPLSQDPMMLAMNSLGYRAMVLGNHEFNFGLETIERARSDARFPWISANTAAEAGVPVKPFAPYIVAEVDGIKIAVIGVTTPAIPNWEQPENYAGYRFLNPKAAVASAVAELRRKERPDIIVVAAHMGLGRAPSGAEIPNENAAYSIATGVPGIDAMVIGHTHQEIAGEKAGNVLIVQPKNWGASLARIDFTLDRGADGRWKIVDKRSSLLPASAQVPPDPGVLKLAKPYHDITERYLNTAIAQSAANLDGRLGRVEDTALVDAVHAVQMHYAKADVSFTALFNPRVEVPAGPVTVRQIAALYIYENQLYAVEGTGRMVKQALENAARYFAPCPDAACSHGPLINSRMPGFNYDMAAGVEYEIDLTRAPGNRILNLRRNGKPIRADEKLRIAVNNYRAGGSGGYEMFRGANVVWRSSEDIRDLIIRYYTERKKLPAEPDRNWRIVPHQAAYILQQEALADSARPGFE
jgi:2',3'-cyclic-nucleotide 2'-phosphodiesterase/3'-nucleotidase